MTLSRMKFAIFLPLAAIAVFIFASSRIVHAGPLPGGKWEMMAVSFPPGREVEVALGGAEKSLKAKGVFKLKWKANEAVMEIELEDLPAVSEAGWAGSQYVLWAVDRDNRAVNLGAVPASGKKAKWSVQTPFRAFGLLITAEKNPKASAPSAAVAMESLLPTNPNLVVPVIRVEVPLSKS